MKNNTTKRQNKQSETLKVVELFAGVGGFRLGLCGTKDNPKNGYDLTWANQWEPATRTQHAALVYKDRFHAEKEINQHFNEDINKVVELRPFPIPKHDLLVGGFPCQDYSVARTLSHAAGIEGKKGVLWWAIHKTIAQRKPRYLMLENVDRLLKSPAKQRGRDFGIILASLADLGYAVEWRVINAADYGMPQRRRRTFILGFRKNTRPFKALRTSFKNGKITKWFEEDGVIARQFPIKPIPDITPPLSASLVGNLTELTNAFELTFENSGVMINRQIITLKTIPEYSGPRTTLGDIALPPHEIPKEFFINRAELAQWKYLKGAKKEPRGIKNGFPYFYTEGPIAFPDSLDKPSRTIITGEGGSGPSRFKHVVKQNNRYRRLTPIELEKLCMFPPNHTEHPTAGDTKRAFFMGNALVVGVIEKLGQALLGVHREE